jgi:multicomponent Na+:H+ antiporter subunit E
VSAARRLRHQLPLLVWLVLVWILLWGTWSWANLISGLVVALAVTTLLPLPPVASGGRFRPLAALVYFGRFLFDVVLSGAQVAWRTLAPGGPPRGAVVQVQLRADSDLLLTMVAETISLVPGSLVLDLDRERRVISVHLLHVADLADVERQKAAVLATEDRVVRAFGGADHRAALGGAAVGGDA